MGVLGLTPFLLKTCPEVIKTLPKRLKELKGKRIVIDGTLITQRLHFVPVPHPYRHVLGWYRIARELQENDVEAVCIFDGKERNIAKAREALRRKEMRRRDMAREAFENERLKRLDNIGSLLTDFRDVPTNSKKRLFEVIQDTAPLDEAAPPKLEIVQTGVTDYIGTEWKVAEITSPPMKHEATSHTTDTTMENTAVKADPYSAPSATPESKPSLDTRPSTSDRTSSSAQDLSVISSESKGEMVADSLISLFHNFRNSVSKLASINKASPEEAPIDESEERTEVFMTKGQYELILEEGKVWDNMGAVEESEEFSMEDEVFKIYQKSTVMFESYARRTRPPTVQNYLECREILEAMGIACVESDGPYEAEALACTLVSHGLADYVASEDTDVIVYEAPLIRNITNQAGPLVVVSGAEVRKGLQLSRTSFVDFALLLGTDFSERIKNIGPARAYKFIKEHGTIEGVVTNETKYRHRLEPDAYLEQVRVARGVFTTLPPIPKKAVLKGKRDDIKTMDILQKYNLSREIDPNWDYSTALAGNFFQDDPRAV
ncbi:PIN domain-like protein [Guyanagaster necrorhizus]|uniref:PIN domain-like protein n=1 Tax=Guyanagaster necrorhizus TaxID=856835 RepID=A0A9P7VY13_9AGAR|nr:PIN domain-like protein [Guyanagaster necrorhizus MCA 3950]KAG7448688.1 PIN domain-like protein [Guyanagaster necrorhizus MCA 3950]